MLAYHLVRHSTGMIVRNFPTALKVSLGPVIVYGLLSLALGILFESPDLEQPSGPFLLWLVIILILMTVLCMAAVSWHRFILLEEPVRWLGLGNGIRPLSYLVVSFVVAIVYVVPFWILILAASGSIGPVVVWVGSIDAPGVLPPDGSDFAIVAVLAFLMLVLITFVVRLSLALPDTALGSVKGVFGSLEFTNGQTPTIGILVLIFIAAQYALGFVASLPFLGTLLALAIQWFLAMLQLSTLTTFYGYYAEGRDLS